MTDQSVPFRPVAGTPRPPTVRGRRRGACALLAAVLLAVGVLGAAGLVSTLERDRHRAEAAAPIAQVDAALVDGALATRSAVRMSRVFRHFDPPPGKLPLPVDPLTYCAVAAGSFGRPGSSSQTGTHEGIDIMTAGGNLVFAVEGGVLTRRYTNTGSAGWGWTLTGDSGVLYKYFHLTADDLGRVEGTRVQMGEVVGYVGDSGTTPKNYHLHFEVRPNDVPIDPYPLLDIPADCRII